jgi:predicted anti-sigma-YlaC factor YlaD
MSEQNRQHPTELLPWLVNDTLDAVERARVEQHVAGCPECRQQVAFLRELRGTIKQQPQQEVGEFGLQKLQHSVRAGSTRRPRWLLPAALAAGIVLVAQSVLLVQTGNRDSYVPMSGGGADDNTFLVEFAPDATEASIRSVLRNSHARIIDGPGALGLYRIVIDQDGATHRDMAAIVAGLRTQTQVIVHIQAE